MRLNVAGRSETVVADQGCGDGGHSHIRLSRDNWTHSKVRAITLCGRPNGRALRPPFRLAKFEGDAAFVYALADKVDGALLQDSIEQAYFAFRKRLRSIKQASSCACQACSRMQSLDVKFVVHHGEFIRQKMSGREELAGRDVILVHRLLKNDVNKSLGGHAYAL